MSFHDIQAKKKHSYMSFFKLVSDKKELNTKHEIEPQRKAPQRPPHHQPALPVRHINVFALLIPLLEHDADSAQVSGEPRSNEAGIERERQLQEEHRSDGAVLVRGIVARVRPDRHGDHRAAVRRRFRGGSFLHRH